MFTIRVIQIEAPRHLKRNKLNNLEEMIQLSLEEHKTPELRFYQAESDTS